MKLRTHLLRALFLSLLMSGLSACETTKVVEVVHYVPAKPRKPTVSRPVAKPRPAGPSEFRVVNQYD